VGKRLDNTGMVGQRKKITFSGWIRDLGSLVIRPTKVPFNQVSTPVPSQYLLHNTFVSDPSEVHVTR
jgi:hypothetical protein